ncbi:uncharacterized protein V1510DRAFT_422527 [Dipodascopsis tothii]|uniref:uncharacterized protein n=1 Tax=Dipodascopsis tothii TaxID=44089 RepID=UPI0034CEA3E7
MAPTSKDRIWIDGCFDFAHHGHAGAMLQARQLGDALVVGVHSDEEIADNKGPVVMTLPERVLAVSACKWATEPVPDAPYVTSPEWMDRYGCYYVVHGDDITTDANGEDCYRVVKDAGRFLVVRRTPNISTTDLVGRMLLCTKTHHLSTLAEADLAPATHALLAPAALERFAQYATAPDGRSPQDGVYVALGTPAAPALHTLVAPGPAPPRHVIYVDGGFDLFFAGHIEFLRLVAQEAEAEAAARGEPVGVVVGLCDDPTVSRHKGLNYPIMNLFERALCVLQCKYVAHVVLQAPYEPSTAFLAALPWDVIAVMHGPTALDSPAAYSDARAAGLYREIPGHAYSAISTETIVERVTRNRGVYEERQRRKGWKAEHEAGLAAAET